MCVCVCVCVCVCGSECEGVVFQSVSVSLWLGLTHLLDCCGLVVQFGGAV